MDEAYTPEEFETMISGNNRSTSSFPEEGMTPEEFDSAFSEPTLDSYNLRNVNSRGRSGFVKEFGKDSQGSLTSKFPEKGVGRSTAKVVDFARNVGAGAVKSLAQTGDLALTLGNEALNLTDDPNFKFGTQSRKEKQDEKS